MSADIAQQLNHDLTASDGIFYMTTTEFVNNFYGFEIGILNNEYFNNYVDE